MGMYIKGIEMPTDNTVLLRIYPKGNDGVSYVEQLDIDDDILDEHWAVPVPPHGDLIDYNFCLKNYELLHDDDGNPVYAVRMRDINAAPAVIEAEMGRAMADCMKCANYNNDYCVFACENGESFKPMTNADRIRAKSDEELAVWLARYDNCPSPEYERVCNNRCGECWLKWLKEEVKDG